MLTDMMRLPLRASKFYACELSYNLIEKLEILDNHAKCMQSWCLIISKVKTKRRQKLHCVHSELFRKGANLMTLMDIFQL